MSNFFFIDDIFYFLKSNFIILFALSFFMNLFFIKIWPLFLKFLNLRKYDALQRVHDGEVARLGGISIYFSLFFIFSINDEYNILNILYCCLPLVIVTLIEDLFGNTHFLSRLLSLVASICLLFNLSIHNFPIIDTFNFLETFFENSIFQYFFFGLCLLVLANGFNFIDGMNGLLGFYTIGVCISCLTLCVLVNDILMSSLIVSIIFLLIVFLFFNYPLGLIFLGDTGAYLLGILIGSWIIIFFSKFTFISSWNAVLILIYPVMEVLISFIRKLYNKKSPFYPDRGHLHLKLYDMVYKSLKNKTIANNLVVIFLSIFWLAPSLLLLWVYHSNFLIFCSIFLLVLVYLNLMIFIPHRDNY